MKTKFLMLLSAVALLASCGGSKKPDPKPDPDPEWKEITNEEAFEIADKINANRQIPDHYMALDKENNRWESLFDRNQHFMGFMDEVEGQDAKNYVVENVKGDSKLYELKEVYDSGIKRVKNVIADVGGINEWWEENEEARISSMDEGYKINRDSLESLIEILEEKRQKHPDNPDKYAKYWFKSYDDASLELYYYQSEKGVQFFSRQILFENNLPVIITKVGGNVGGETLSTTITYDYESSVTIPEEADPGTWGS